MGHWPMHCAVRLDLLSRTHNKFMQLGRGPLTFGMAWVAPMCVVLSLLLDRTARKTAVPDIVPSDGV
jgi:hypothetical protein